MDTTPRGAVSVPSYTVQEAAFMSIFRRASVAVVLVAMAVGTVLIAKAQAATSVLGSTVCVREGNAGSSGLEYLSSGVINSVGAPANVICSLFRDNTTNTNGMQDLEVSIFDPSGTAGGVTCTAFSFDRLGVIRKKVDRTATATGNIIIDWGGSVNVSVTRGHYAIRCTLPAGATLRSIFYTEP